MYKKFIFKLKNRNSTLSPTPRTDTTTLGTHLRAHRHVQLANGSGVCAKFSLTQQVIDQEVLKPD